MLRRHTMALLIAGVFAGTQAVIASITPPETGESVEKASSTEQEITVAGGASEVAAPDPVAEAISETTGSAASLSEIKSSVFPSSADDVEMLPSLRAYLERKAATQLAGAPGNVFPSSADEVQMLPSLVAYLDQREAMQLAAADNMADDRQAAADRHAALFARETSSSR